MEKWDLFTSDRQPAGKTMYRGETVPEGLYHQVVHVWLRNSRGQYLISQRSPDKSELPLMWECVGGSVLSGEDSLGGALREVKEEVGIDLLGCPGKVIFTDVGRVIGGVVYRDILDVWLFECDSEPDLDAADTDEVACSRWLTPGQIREYLDGGLLIPSLDYFFTRVLPAEL